MMRYLETTLFLLALIAVAGCATPPVSWEATVNPTWRTIEVNEDLEFEDAWHSLSDMLLKKGFDFEQLDKLNGYAQTHWSYTTTGVKREDYRVKVTIKFAGKAKDQVEIKTTAEFGGDGDWRLGTDHKLLDEVLTEVKGKIGR